jgi:hypothetical protein
MRLGDVQKGGEDEPGDVADGSTTIYTVEVASMTLLEYMDSLGALRDKAYRDAARLTIEIQACQDVMSHTETTFNHVEERQIYTAAYNVAVEIQRNLPQEVTS